jgi:hypothetical protein
MFRLKLPVACWQALALMTGASAALPACSRIPTPDTASAPLAIEPTTLDLRTVSVGSPAKSMVTAHNLTDKLLKVHWHSSCECVAIEPPYVEIKPWAACTIHVHVAVHDEDTGTLAVSITADSDTGSEPSGFEVVFAANPSNVKHDDSRSMSSSLMLVRPPTSNDTEPDFSECGGILDE